MLSMPILRNSLPQKKTHPLHPTVFPQEPAILLACPLPSPALLNHGIFRFLLPVEKRHHVCLLHTLQPNPIQQLQPKMWKKFWDVYRLSCQSLLTRIFHLIWTFTRFPKGKKTNLWKVLGKPERSQIMARSKTKESSLELHPLLQLLPAEKPRYQGLVLLQ